MKHNGQILTLLAAFVLFVAVSATYGQATQQQSGAPETQLGGGDPIRQLNLTPEQREQIRSIREQNKTERAAINERLRESNRALEAELDSDNPDEALVEQRLRDVGAAQAAATRMRILTELRIRRVLTSEQRIILRSLQQQAREVRRERLLNNPDERQRRQAERSRVLQNQRNGLGPIFPRRDNPRRPRL
ncbi:MAG TPA: periplasmic heavy metal sensor [Pyrinomonadaceae bacterium]|jgi:Spy/CpxP family protein refolding chaperone